MALAVVGTTTTAEASGTTGVTNNVPTGVVDGNLLVWRWSGAGNASVPTTPTGWTVLQTGTTTVNGMAVWYRIASSEPASYTLGTLGASMRTTGTMSAYSGVDTVTPWDVATPAFSAGTTATTCPAITPTTAGAWVLGFGDANVASGVTNTTFSSSNLTAIDGQVSSTQGAATNNVGAIGHFVWSSGAFTPAWTTSNASVRTLGGSAAMRPAAAAAAVFPAGPARRVARPPTSTRRRRRVEVVPTQVVAAPPATKVSDSRQQLARLFPARRRRPAEVTPAQVVAAPPAKVADSRRRRRVFLAARQRFNRPFVPPSATGPAVLCDTDLIPYLTPDAGLLGADVQYDNDGTPYVPAAGTDVALDTDSVATPFVIATCGAVLTMMARRVTRPPMPRHRGRVEVTPAQIVVAPPAYVRETRRVVRRFVATRRGRLVGVIPPQIPAPDRNRRRQARGFVTRRRNRGEVVPPQIVVTPPVYVPTMPAKHVLRGVPRRGRRAEVVPPQVVVAPPAYVPTVPAKHNLRGMQRRGRHVVVVPPQQAAPAIRYVATILPRHALRGVPRRGGRRADVPLAQTPAHRGQPRRPIRILARRVRRAVTVIAQSLVPTLTPEVTLTATVYDHVLVADTHPHTLTAETQARTLTASVHGHTLTAATLDRTIEES